MRLAVKDNIWVRGKACTAGSLALHGFRAPEDATAVRRLRESGVQLVGRTNMDEFGMGSASIYSAYGPVVSPWSPAEGTVELTAGGSSGGSAVAVASGECEIALGSDTGGSVRQPAAFCGVVGFKPTYGRVSRYGLVAYGSSLDCIGVLGQTVGHAAAALQVMSGPDAQHDATCLTQEAPPCTALPAVGANGDGAPSRLRVGIPRECHVQELPDAVAEAWETTALMLKDAGAEIVPVSLPSFKHALPAYYVLASAEAASNLSRYDGLRYGFRFPLPAERDAAAKHGTTTEHSVPHGIDFVREELQSVLSDLRLRHPASAQSLSSPHVPGLFVDELLSTEQLLQHVLDVSADAKESHDQGATLRCLTELSRSIGFGEEVQRRILVGCFVLMQDTFEEYYVQAARVRQALSRELQHVLHHDVDVLLSPTAPTLPFPIHGGKAPADALSPLRLMLNDVMTVPANLAGLPAISVPVGTTEATAAPASPPKGAPDAPPTTLRVPLGMQLMGRACDERTLVTLAQTIENRVGRVTAR